MPELAPLAFISYSREDSDFVLRLARDLKASGASVWLDQLDIAPGVPWDNAIEEALIVAPRMLLVLSPASARSDNVRNEISFALERGKIVIPVLYLDCDVPLRLQRTQRIDFRSDYARGLAALLAYLTVANPDPEVLKPDAEAQRLRVARTPDAQTEPRRPRWKRITRKTYLIAAAAFVILAVALIYGLRKYTASVFGQGSVLAAREDYTNAVPLFNRACNLGEPRACAALGVLYAHGGGGAMDTKRAAVLLQKGCDAADFAACGQLGLLYENGDGVAKDAPKAAALFRQACDGGDATGCNDLGNAYDSASGVPNDPKQAASLFQKSCDGNEYTACDRLGLMYQIGHDVDKDELRSAELFEKGCDGGNAESCGNLGYLFIHGEGVAKDETHGAQLYQKGCDGGNSTSCGALSYLYQNGTGVTSDEQRAIQLGQKACDGGSSSGCIVMGNYYHIYAKPIDDPTAKNYFNKACSLGGSTACEYVKKIK